MLELTLNNHIIPLPRDFRMRVTIKTPFFQFDKIPFSYSLDFSLPINEYTSAIFAHPERITKRRWGTENKYSGFKVTFKGSIFLNGSLTLTVQGKNYNLTAVDGVGVLSDATAEKSILDIAKFKEELDFINSSNYDPDVHPYCCFPIINQEFFKDKGLKIERTKYVAVEGGGTEEDGTYEMEALTFCFLKTVGAQVNALNPDKMVKQIASTIDISDVSESVASYMPGEVTVVSPFFFVNHIIKEALKDNKIHIVKNFIADDSVLRNLCIYNNFDITEMDYNKRELFESNGSMEVDLNGDPIFGDTGWTSIGFKIVGYIRSYLNKLVPANHLPKMKIGDLLLSLQNEFNLIFDFIPNKTVNIFSREVLIGMEAINLEKYLVGEIDPGQQENTAINFIRQNDDKDAVFSERFVDLSDRRADIKAPVADWEALMALVNPDQGEIRQILSNQKFYEYKWITNSDTDNYTKREISTDILGWEETSIALQNGWYEFGRQKVKKIETNFSTCYCPTGRPFVSQPGNQKGWRSIEQSFSPRLLIYLGNNSGSNETANLSFEYEKAGNGLIEKHWKKTSRMLANALPMTVYGNFPVNVLHSIIFNKCLPYRNDEASFFIDEFNFDLMIDRVGTVEMKVYKRD